VRTRRPGFTIFEAILDDGTGSLRTIFFNQPYLQKWLVPGASVFAWGAPQPSNRFHAGLALENPQVELDAGEDADGLSVGRVVPIYRKLPGLAPRTRRRVTAQLLDTLGPLLPERLPPALLSKWGLPPLAESLREAHFPGSAGGTADPGPWEKRTSPHLARLVFEEFLEFQAGLARRRSEAASHPAPVLSADDAIRARLRSALPFPLTGAQKRVIRDIRADFLSGSPMRRLLQGDVGSGKTIVAVLSALLAAERGWQTALMAPTEILAEQHAGNVHRLLAGTKFSAALLTGRVRGRPRAELLRALAAGEVDLLVGTHALLERPVAFARLGLAVVDEQHRFGVAQRAALTAREAADGTRPHLLVMSATPIPRSLALTLYGDLDVSTLDEKPPGRTPVATRLLPEAERRLVFHEIAREAAAGGQAYVVVPLVEESDVIDARAVEKHVEDVRAALPGLSVGVVHGRMSAEERERTMADFASGRTSVLAATTVIEVGVDVPNASYMVVENAERFGLAQLHQLRGRIGRGKRASRCVLLYGEKASAEALERLGILVETEDGFRIAEEDLARRGPGDALGTRQSGIPMFRVGDLLGDRAWMQRARDEAASRPGLDRVLKPALFLRGPLPAAGD
jgi:ATP-dependent DNA helicase RecG